MFGSKKSELKQPESIITAPQDTNKQFGAESIRRSLEILGECVINKEAYAIQALMASGFITLFVQNLENTSWLAQCKTYICDTLKNTELQKEYLLHATKKQYLNLDQTITLLFSAKTNISSNDIATILNTINHATGKHVNELNRTLQLRQGSNQISTQNIFAAMQQIKESQNKEALLRILPLDQIQGRELAIFDIITQLPKEDRKGLMERFFFNATSSINFSGLISQASKENINVLSRIFDLMEATYSPGELQQKAKTIEEPGAVMSSTIFRSILRIPAGEQRVQYLAEKSPIHNFIPYTLFDDKNGLVPQKILSVEEAKKLLSLLNKAHPNNIFIDEATRKFERYLENAQVFLK